MREELKDLLLDSKNQSAQTEEEKQEYEVKEDATKAPNIGQVKHDADKLKRAQKLQNKLDLLLQQSIPFFDTKSQKETNIKEAVRRVGLMLQSFEAALHNDIILEKLLSIDFALCAGGTGARLRSVRNKSVFLPMLEEQIKEQTIPLTRRYFVTSNNEIHSIAFMMQCFGFFNQKTVLEYDSFYQTANTLPVDALIQTWNQVRDNLVSHQIGKVDNAIKEYSVNFKLSQTYSKLTASTNVVLKALGMQAFADQAMQYANIHRDIFTSYCNWEHEDSDVVEQEDYSDLKFNQETFKACLPNAKRSYNDYLEMSDDDIASLDLLECAVIGMIFSQKNVPGSAPYVAKRYLKSAKAKLANVTQALKYSIGEGGEASLVAFKEQLDSRLELAIDTSNQGGEPIEQLATGKDVTSVLKAMLLVEIKKQNDSHKELEINHVLLSKAAVSLAMRSAEQSVKIFKALKSYSIVNPIDFYAECAIEASRHGNTKLLEEIITSLSVEDVEKIASHVGKSSDHAVEGLSLLHWMAISNQSNALEMLCTKISGNLGLLCNVLDAQPEKLPITPIFFAATLGHTAVIKILMDFGANAQIKSQFKSKYLSSFRWALKYDRLDVFSTLYEGIKIQEDRTIDVNGKKQLRDYRLRMIFNVLEAPEAIEMASWLLEHQISRQKYTDSEFIKILKSAIRSGDLPRVKKLREIYLKGIEVGQHKHVFKALINSQAKSRTSLLGTACKSNATDIAVFLLEHGAKAYEADGERYTPIYGAVFHGNKDLLELLFSKMTDVEKEDALNGDHSQCYRLFCRAYRTDNYALMEVLLKNGGKVITSRDYYDDTTPFEYVTMYGSVVLMKLLHEYCPESHRPILLNLVQEEGVHSPLVYACKTSVDESRYEKIKWLLSEGVKVPKKLDGYNNLFSHLSPRGTTDELELLWRYIPKDRRDAFLNQKDWCDNTPIELAYLNENYDAMYWFLDKGVSPASADIEQDLLHLIIKKGDLDNLKKVVQYHPVPNCKNAKGQTMLHLACKYRHPEIIKWLVEEMHVDCTIADKEGNTPLHVVCQQGDRVMVDVLALLYTNISKEKRTEVLNQDNAKVESPRTLAQGCQRSIYSPGSQKIDVREGAADVDFVMNFNRYLAESMPAVALANSWTTALPVGRLLEHAENQNTLSK